MTRAGAAAAALAALLACAPHPPPMPQPTPAPDWSRVTTFLDSVVAAGAAPGTVLGVSVQGRHFFYGTGRLGLDDPTRPDSTTIYDLASVTKVVALTTAAMYAVSEKELDLNAPVQRYVPAFKGTHKDRVTIRHLLTHSSGLPAWRPLYREAATREEALALADITALDTLPGTRFVYSDIGAIVLTQAVETAMHAPLDSLMNSMLGQYLPSTRYRPPPEWLPRIAPTENDPWRGRILRGEVHDENAARLGGVSGNAGLFSDARDLVRFGEWLLALLDKQPIQDSLDLETVARFATRQNLPSGSSRALGWDTPSDGGSAGTKLSHKSIGHTGFTGTSIWIDPTRDLVIVLLSNRVHPTRANQQWGPLRGRVADLVVTTLYPDTP